jgi:hypothetical protein
VGQISIATAPNLPNYRFAAFLKVGKEAARDLANGMKNLARMIALNPKKNIRTVAFPVCDGLACVGEMMQAMKNDGNFEEIEELEAVFLFRKAGLFEEICARVRRNAKVGFPI